MPVKVRCPQCQKVLAAPDAARGKAIRCKNCDGRVPVPAGKGQQTAAKAAKKKAAKKKAVRQAQTTSFDDEDYLTNLDLRHLEDRSARACPKCGADVPEEEVDCPSCGINIETLQRGERLQKEARLKKFKGADPADFYKVAWVDSWAFIKENWQLAVRTGVYWSVFTLLYLGCLFMVLYCEKLPPKVFWIGLTALCGLGVPGWYWFLSTEIIRRTMDGNKNFDRINLDFFQTVALGVKYTVWPYVLLLPTMPIFVALMIPVGILSVLTAGAAAAPALIICCAIYISLPYIFYPIAMCHMSCPYTYKAWIMWEMLKIGSKNVKPMLYWCMMAFVVMLPFLLLEGLVFGFGSRYAGPRIYAGLRDFTVWALELMGTRVLDPANLGFIGTCVLVLSIIVTAIVIVFPFVFVLAFPAVFLMRANGLLAFHNRRTLELVFQQKEGVPVGFWVRFLAYWIDSLLIPLTPLLVMKDKRATLFAWFGLAVCVLTFFLVPGMFIPAAALYSAYLPWMYFAVQEGTYDQATLGKAAFGLIVTDMEGKPIDLKRASIRWLGKCLSFLLLGGGCIPAGLTEKKQALHDQMAKTLVVWRGE